MSLLEKLFGLGGKTALVTEQEAASAVSLPKALRKSART